ncbi:hypothetical protein CCHR01_16955 [Colletotrichum chrysophilum]|uniref:Uncharacterized protein n=1 Tax=Colletotrichum chrysophilum TaxID=1836956 RepID=A0AAD9A2Z1_9PEZI|nr:hypothetical protein CCHR01_16955 [Colletotrichum chrysophilum]
MSFCPQPRPTVVQRARALSTVGGGHSDINNWSHAFSSVCAFSRSAPGGN